MRRTRTLLLSTLALSLLAGGATATASDDPGYAPFDDGPFGVHEAGIDWLAGTGVTAGCTTLAYCPTDPVTRAQMATFLQRLAGHADRVAPSVDAATLDGRTAPDLEVINGFVRITERARVIDAVVDLEVACPSGTHALGGGGGTDGLFAQHRAGPTADGTGWYGVWVATDHRAHEVDAHLTVTCAPTDAPVVSAAAAGDTDQQRRDDTDRLRDQVATRR